MATEYDAALRSDVRASDVVTELDELALCLQNASRFNPESPSNKQLRKMLRRASVLDTLEEAVSYMRCVEKGGTVKLSP